MPEFWAGFSCGAAAMVTIVVALYFAVNIYLDRRDRRAEVWPRHRNTAGQETRQIFGGRAGRRR